jgi:hypothetical protein
MDMSGDNDDLSAEMEHLVSCFRGAAGAHYAMAELMGTRDKNAAVLCMKPAGDMNIDWDNFAGHKPKPPNCKRTASANTSHGVSGIVFGKKVQPDPEKDRLAAETFHCAAGSSSARSRVVGGAASRSVSSKRSYSHAPIHASQMDHILHNRPPRQDFHQNTQHLLTQFHGAAGTSQRLQRDATGAANFCEVAVHH